MNLRTSVQNFLEDTVEFTFKYIAPSTPNVTDTIFANGNSTNNSSSSDGTNELR
ncbi:MAG: hypothetical protein IPG09_14605 [Ignavibacteria bacterium]|nr:hypothetical protein [Ignavibacteria bacterium]